MLNKLESRSPRNAQARKQAQVDYYNRVFVTQVQKAWKVNKACGDEVLRQGLERVLRSWDMDKLAKELLQ